MDVITSEGLTKRYGRRTGITGLQLAVPEGAVYGFLGPNGAGKTTTIRLLLGLLRPSAGRATIFGHDVWSQSARIKRDLGYVPGDLRLYPWMTGRSALKTVGRIRGCDLTRGGGDLAERFELDPTVPVRKMSRGMRQKLGLVLALAHRPKLLVLDEPTAGLDPIMQDRLRRMLREGAASGHTVFFSSHSLAEVEDVCDRVGIVRAGRLVADEMLSTLRERARRTVRIRWSPGTPADWSAPTDLLEVHGRSDHAWECALIGTVPRLLEWLVGKPLEDLSIGQPDLEDVFRGYYESELAS